MISSMIEAKGFALDLAYPTLVELTDETSDKSVSDSYWSKIGKSVEDTMIQKYFYDENERDKLVKQFHVVFNDVMTQFKNGNQQNLVDIYIEKEQEEEQKNKEVTIDD